MSWPCNLHLYIRRAVFVCSKLLPQCVCDRRETRDYYGPRHGACCKGVGGRSVAAPEESAARILSLTENDAMFFVG